MEFRDDRPWYRQFWPWFLITIVMIGVVASSIAATLAIRNPPHMVTGDYAPLGKVLVDTHVRYDRARALGISGRLDWQGDRLVVVIEAIDPAAMDDRLLLTIQHPADATLDRRLVLIRADAGRYEAEGGGDWSPRARLIVSDLQTTWWVSGRLSGPAGSAPVVLRPERL